MSEVNFLALTTKPSAQLSYTFSPASGAASAKPVLVVFLNGLGLPQAFWQPVIAQLKTLREGSVPAFVTYDRFGQGQTTDRDPQDAGAEDATHGHDCIAAVRDLRQFLSQISSERLALDLDSISLVLVGNSIGCALARLYAEEYPGTVAALLLLDSVLANSDFVSVFPDPEAAEFDPASIHPIPLEAIKAVRAGARRIFHPDVGSKEGLSRRNLRELLPASDGPLLQGPNGHGPYVTVVGHDFDAFAEESAKMGPPKPVTNRFVNPFWQRYNEGLTKITAPEFSKGPIIAPGAGHFVQKDNPEFVVQELNEVLEKVL